MEAGNPVTYSNMYCFSSTQPVHPESQLTQSVSKLSTTKSTHSSHGSTSDSMKKVSKSVQKQLLREL